MEGNLRFKIDWASLTVEAKFNVFALFYFVFEGNIASTSPRGAYVQRGDLKKGFCVTGLEGLYLLAGRAYFRNFTVFPFIQLQKIISDGPAQAFEFWSLNQIGFLVCCTVTRKWET